jgi:parallel beta helix pectate lyase-like protein
MDHNMCWSSWAVVRHAEATVGSAQVTGITPGRPAPGPRRWVAGRALGALLLVGALAVGPTPAGGAQVPLDCQKKSLSDAVDKAKGADRTILFTGVCAGPIVIRTDGLTVQGVGQAIIDGGGQDAVTIAGAHGVLLTHLEVRNGQSGILGSNGAHVTLTDVTAQDNSVFGVSLQTASSALLTDVTVTGNGLHGLDLETGSSATVTGTLAASNNGVFGVNVNGSAITFAQAQVSATANALGIQIATNANAFLSGPATVLEANNNLAVGLTVVSGAHLVAFGGTITASGNPLDGVSVNSKAGLDLDAGATLHSFNNGNGVLLQEGSTMTVFNLPQFSGVPGFSTLDIHDNTGSGLRVLNGSTLTLSNQAELTSRDNGQVGLSADNGVGVTLVNTTLTDNTVRDLQLTFGARADLQTTTVGTYACDATVLVRGTSGISCPH